MKQTKLSFLKTKEFWLIGYFQSKRPKIFTQWKRGWIYGGRYKYQAFNWFKNHANLGNFIVTVI